MELKKRINFSYLVIGVCLGILTFIYSAQAVTLLMVPQGGTGAGTFTAGGILQGDGTGAIQSNIMSGDGTLSASGVLTVSADAVETITVEGKATETIAMGKAVYISGAVGNNVQFSLADNTVYGKTNVAGVAIESKTAGQTIRIRHLGQLDNFDTSSWSDGDDLYLSTSGSLINTVPTSGVTLHVAYVEYSHATLGDILLHVCGEKNIGAPASTDLFVRMGDSAGVNKLSYRDYANNEVAYTNSDGEISAVEFIGPLTGNASTATALAANGANCGAGNYPLGVDASGAVESCTADANTTYTGGTGITLTGTVFSTTDGDILHDSLSGFVANEHLDWTADLGATNIHSGNYTDTNTTYTAGRSLTLDGTTINADSELYHHEKCLYIEDPVAADDLKSLFHFRKAATITGMWCESDQTVNMDLQLDDGTPADINGTDLVCDTTPADDTSLGGDTGAGAGERLDLAITSVSGTPTWVSICFNFTYDD